MLVPWRVRWVYTTRLMAFSGGRNAKLNLYLSSWHAGWAGGLKRYMTVCGKVKVLFLGHATNPEPSHKE